MRGPPALFFSARIEAKAQPHRPVFALSPCGSLALTDSKTFKKPRRPFEKERLDNELKIVGEYGLRNKRELWRVQFALNKLRNAARVLLTLDEKDPKRIFEGEAIMRRMYRYGLLVSCLPAPSLSHMYTVLSGVPAVGCAIERLAAEEREGVCRGVIRVNGLGSGENSRKCRWS